MDNKEELDVPLDIEMAYLELDEKSKSISDSEIPRDLETSVDFPNCESSTRRSTRKRNHPVECDNRRFTAKPKKMIEGSYKATVNYYLDKRVKKLPTSLETIFEEPKNGTYMSKRPMRRYLSFQEVGVINRDKSKVKKRSMKAKKLHRIRKMKKAPSMELLLKKLMTIEPSE